MRIILVMVSSVDGKITKWDNPNIYEWTSKEDQAYFSSLIQKNDLIVMGRETYEVVKPKPKHGKLRIVLTHNPAKYKSLTIAGQLEFTDESPRELVDRLAKKGYKKLLLVGGGAVNTSFFKEGLVDELWLTVEPRMFGKGKMLVSEAELDIQLELISAEKLNDQGTMLLNYKIVDKKNSLR